MRCVEEEMCRGGDVERKRSGEEEDEKKRMTSVLEEDFHP